MAYGYFACATTQCRQVVQHFSNKKIMIIIYSDSRRLRRSSLYNKEVMMDSNKLNNNAHQNPSTLNPFTNSAVSKMMAALITNRNKPNVNKVSGSVSNIRMGFTMAFNMASTIAKMMAAQKESIWTPLRIYDNPKAMIEVTMMRMIKFIAIALRGLRTGSCGHEPVRKR